MILARRHWIAAGFVSLGAHSIVFTGFLLRQEATANLAAGAPAALWGVSLQSVMTEIEPATPSKEVLSPVEETYAPPPALTPVAQVNTSPAETVAAIADEAAAAVAIAPEVTTVTQVNPAATQKAEPPAEDFPVTVTAAVQATVAAQEVEANPEKKHKTPKEKTKRRRRAALASGGPVGQAAGNRGAAQSASNRASHDSYAGRIASHLRRYKRYPRGIDRRQIHGTVRLVFTVSRSGGLQSVRLARGSGHSVLDHEALAMVRRAVPFPAFLPTLSLSTMTFTVPIRFTP